MEGIVQMDTAQFQFFYSRVASGSGETLRARLAVKLPDEHLFELALRAPIWNFQPIGLNLLADSC
jgi:hypothetical protein